MDLVYRQDKVSNVVSTSFRLDDTYNININKNIDIFKNLILRKIDTKSLYTTYIKIRYNNNLYLMAGNQLGFKYNTDQDLIDLADVVVDRVEQALEKYSLDSDQVVYIQLLFRKVSTNIITEFSSDEKKGISGANKNDSKMNSHNIPISVKEDSLGIPLDTYSNSDNYINRIDYKIKGVVHNFMDKILDKNKHLKSNHNAQSCDNKKLYHYIHS